MLHEFAIRRAQPFRERRKPNDVSCGDGGRLGRRHVVKPWPGGCRIDEPWTRGIDEDICGFRPALHVPSEYLGCRDLPNLRRHIDPVRKTESDCATGFHGRNVVVQDVSTSSSDAVLI